MTDLILEIYSEEIPSSQINMASESLGSMISNILDEQKIHYKKLENYNSPRRICVIFSDVDTEVAPKNIEIKGPKINANEIAINGFLHSHNVSLKDLTIKKIAGNEFYFLEKTEKAILTKDLLGKKIPEILANFPWKKSMKWGSSSIRWVRPIKNILCVLGGEIIEFSFGHISSNNISFGHFFHNHEKFEVKNIEDYKSNLLKLHVMFDQNIRKSTILQECKKIASEKNLTLVENENLLDEVTGLVEWPKPILGVIDKKYMTLPEEVLMTSMRLHQKYFSLRTSDGRLSNHFITISNSVSGNEEIIRNGNQKVLSARLEDALFFLNKDLEKPLESYVEKLKSVTFHEKLGSVYSKVERIYLIAEYISTITKNNINLHELKKAVELSKADLSTEMVSEFPELQGKVGSYYAKMQNESENISNAISQHYHPLSQTDFCPQNIYAFLISIADKIDNIVGLWIAKEKPTGSKDPFALRRCAIGIIRLLISNEISIDISNLVNTVMVIYEKQNIAIDDSLKIAKEIKEFIQIRFTAFLKSSGVDHEIITSVAKNFNDIYLDNLKILALLNLLKTEDGKILLRSYTRATNIVFAEQQKDNIIYKADIDFELLKLPEEKSLYQAITSISDIVKKSLIEHQYISAMQQMKSLIEPINTFFDKIVVNDDNNQLRINRLALLVKIKTMLDDFADFSEIKL